jgi:protein-disulfide isomerase
MSHQKNQKRQAQQARARKERARIRLITILLIILGSAILVFVVIQPQLKSVGTIISITPATLPNPNGLSLGETTAPATIEVFEDFQCPACQYFTESIEPLVIKNLVATGKARYVFHNYPFIDGQGAKNGGESDQAANAAMCTNDQGKFWDMHALLYANWKGENQGNFSNDRLKAMAKNIGLDMNAFNTCFDTNKHQAEIQADFDKGITMAVSGTPTIFVNGKQVGQPGQIATYDEITQAVLAVQ